MSALPSAIDSTASVMLPHGGYVVVEFQAHFDESGTHDGAPVLCVAGYIMEISQARKLAEEWNKALNWPSLPRPLKHFHMVECAHGSREFKGIPVETRSAIEKRMIEIIKLHTVQGIVVSIDKAEFDRLMPKDRTVSGEAYSFCSQIIMAGISHWIANQPIVEGVSYFFEAGADDQAESNWIMNSLFKIERAKTAHRYRGHAFVPKLANPGVQAADLLCWQWYTDRKHQIAGKPRRKDCESLLEHPHEAIHIGADKITQLAERLAEISRPLTREAFFFGETE